MSNVLCKTILSNELGSGRKRINDLVNKFKVNVRLIVYAGFPFKCAKCAYR